MSNVTYAPEAQQKIQQAEGQLDLAIQALRHQNRGVEDSNANDYVDVEVQADPVEVSNTTSVEVSNIPSDPIVKKEPRRSEFVETDDPKIRERINDLYGQVKKSDARNQMIIQHNQILEQKLSEALSRVQNIENNAKQVQTSQVENELKVQLRNAKEAYDFDAEQAIQERLIALNVEKRLAEERKKIEEKAPPVRPQAAQQYEAGLVQSAAYVEYLSTEKDAQGNLKRPYLQDWHPKNKEAVEMFEKIPAEFAAAGKQVDLATIMQVLDERIAGTVKTTSRVASVLGSDESRTPQNTIKLSQEEIRVAKLMGIAPEAYARQKSLLNR